MRLVWTALAAVSAFGQAPEFCARPESGGLVRQPPELRSANGQLRATFSLRTMRDVRGLTRYCYLSGENMQSPTLRVHAGDEVILTLRNDLTKEAGTAGEAAHKHSATEGPGACGDSPAITAASSNLHFHGVSIPPLCHQDEVVRTLVGPGDPPFEYRFRIPAAQPPGLYWYHPHAHGFSELQVQGGASGALIVEGIERANPDVAGLPERILVLRDQPMSGPEAAAELAEQGEEQWRPGLDASVNFVPVLYPDLKPAELRVQPARKEFWRVLNASSDTFFDLQLIYWPPQDERVRTAQVVAVDGAPTGASYAAKERQSVMIPPGGRAEFTITTPPAGMHSQLVTRIYDNGPAGERATYRVLATVRSTETAGEVPRLPAAVPGARVAAFRGLRSLKPARGRALYFSEKVQDPANPKRSTSYFLTVGDARPAVFDMSQLTPNITARQGTLEDWTIENRARESHVFHIHQTHFQVLEQDGRAVLDEALRDTVELPFWDGQSAYPKVKIRLDFRDPSTVGVFPFHCHILEHEDGGMMGLIAVVRR